MNINVDQNTSTLFNLPEKKTLAARRARIQFQLYRINNHIIYLLNKLMSEESREEAGINTDSSQYDM